MLLAQQLQISSCTVLNHPSPASTCRKALIWSCEIALHNEDYTLQPLPMRRSVEQRRPPSTDRDVKGVVPGRRKPFPTASRRCS